MPIVTKHTQDLGTYMSLFDFLGKPAGNKIGKEVFDYSKKIRITIKYRDITTPKYNGNVCLYPLGFLTLYFNSENNLNVVVEEPKEKADLPF
jgi:hypothetical protein